jgi:hypothetical protein
MGFKRQFSNLCGPALFYFLISMIAVIICILQNIGNKNNCKIGNMNIKGNKFMIFLFKIVFILFWTWVLALICRAGYKGISWFLVLFPFIMMIFVSILVVENQKY